MSADELHRRDDAPPTLAFVEDDDAEDVVAGSGPVADVEPGPSTGFCEASANIWVHSAALNLIGAQANPEMTNVALANVAEWLERSTFFDEAGADVRMEMFNAFRQLQIEVETNHESDWHTFQTSTAYANDTNAQLYESERGALLSFVNESCDDLSVADLRGEADARTDDLLAQFGTAPSEVVESDSLPGHSIFTHSSGRLIASFPTAWPYRELTSDALIDLVASPDVDRFLDADAIDGVRIQLVEAADLDAFVQQMANTDIASSCFSTDTLADPSPVRISITESFECSDHGATVIGQFSSDRSLGVLIQARYDRVSPSRADLLRLASISNSVLWS